MSVNNFMQRFYHFTCIVFLSSYTPKKHGSIYDYHVMIYSLENNGEKISFSMQIRLCLAISTLPVLYYSTLGMKIIDYDEQTRFIIGDIFMILDNIDEMVIINVSLLISFCITMVWFSLYYTYDFRKSLEFCTMIQCWSEIEQNEPILFTIPEKFPKYSRSTMIILHYSHSLIRKNFSKFKYFFIQFYCYTQSAHCKFLFTWFFSK